MMGLRRWAVALITLVAGAVVIILALRSPNGLDTVDKVVGLITGLTPLAVGVIAWARRHPSAAHAVSTPDQIEAAQRQLAGQVSSQWRNEITVRQLDDPGPLAVRWRFTELDIVDHPEHIAGADVLPPSAGRVRLRFSGRTDQIGEMVKELRKLTRRRLVIIGDPGMGKTTVAMLLLRELLDHPEAGEPVPVLLTMSDWDPNAQTLYEWLARRLAEDYPALRAAAFGTDAPRSLIAQRRILPILDGLDEQPEQIRPKILIRLNEVAGDPIVLTCRTAEYEAAVVAPGGDALTGGAVIEPAPLTPADAARYVAGCLPPRAGAGWPDLLTTLNGDPTAPISQALATPLALWLLRKTYIDTRANPAGLRDTSRFPTADAVVEHLLDHVVDALISINPPRGQENEHPFRPRRAWDPTDANKSLAFLAHHLTTVGSRDLAWWQLHHAKPRLGKVVAGAVAGLVMTIAVGLDAGRLEGLTSGLISGPILGLVFGIAVGLATRLTIWHVVALLLGLDMLGAAVSAGLINSEPVLGLAFGTLGSICVATVIALAARQVGSTPAQTPAYADLRLRGRVRLLARKLTGWGEGRLLVRFMPAFAIGFAFGLIIDGVAEKGLLTGLVNGLVLGLAATLAIGLIDWAETPQTNERPRTPTSSFHRDRQLVQVKAITAGFALGIALSVVHPLSAWAGLDTGLLFAVAIVLGVGLHQPSGRYLVTVLVLTAQHRVPLRLLSFLDDAHRLGILHEAGPVYRFRHAKLHDRLANTYRGD